ncbi:AMP-binding protein, partial [bacterium]|nr:AMP-binding protein [bacterium]
MVTEQDLPLTAASSLHGLLAESARRFPEKPAIHYLAQTLTYGELFKEAGRLGRHLTECGVSGGDRVFIAMPNCPAFVIAYFAIFEISAVAVPFSVQYTPRELASLMAHSRPVAGICSEGLCPVVEAGIEASGLKPLLVCARWDAAGAIEYSHSGEIANGERLMNGNSTRDGPALILYTSGTTGEPKGVVLTHGNITSNALACRAAMPVSEEDVFIAFLPMYHSFAFTACFI